MRYISPRRVVLLAALLLLIAPWASAAPRHGNAQPVRISGIPDVLSLAWSFITGGWMKEGCMIDPDGRCVTPVQTKEGCTIEPDGRCVASSPVLHQKAPANNTSGSHGRTRRPALRTKEGCQVDPGGRCIS
jgi:hypothetical protein